MFTKENRFYKILFINRVYRKNIIAYKTNNHLLNIMNKRNKTDATTEVGIYETECTILK